MNDLKIIQSDNGYILEYTDYDEVNKPLKRFISVEEPPDGDETITTQKLLWEIQEHFTLFGSKHDLIRIRVIREKNGKEISD